MDKKMLAYLGVGAVLLYVILKPKSAAAAPATALPPPTVTPEPALQTNAPTAETFKDPGTGATLVGPSEPIRSGQNYTVKAGESWSNIASRVYKDFRWWPFLWDHNRRTFPNRFTLPDSLPVGSVIEIPNAPPTDPAYKDIIMARAKAHLDYWKAKPTLPKTVPMPPIVSSLTPLPKA